MVRCVAGLPSGLSTPPSMVAGLRAAHGLSTVATALAARAKFGKLRVDFFKFWLFVAVGCVHSDDDLPRFRLLRIDLSFPRTSSFSSCLCARLRLCHVCLVLSQCFFSVAGLLVCMFSSGAFCSVAASGLEPNLGLFPVPGFVLSSLLGHLVFGFLSQQPASEIRTCLRQESDMHLVNHIH